MRTKNPKKDQRLMVDNLVLDRIVGYASLSKDDAVLEIGAGSGHLTVELAEKAGLVIAVEKNHELCSTLRERVKSMANVRVVEGDALKIELLGFTKVVSNLPYSISKSVTVRLISHGFRQAFLLYQREFAHKLNAQPGSANYRFITALVRSTCNVELLMDVPPSAFKPRPMVSSTLVKLTQRFKPDSDYIRFVQDVFNHKNKYLKNTLGERTPEGWADRKPVETRPEDFPLLWELFKKTSQ